MPSTAPPSAEVGLEVVGGAFDPIREKDAGDAISRLHARNPRPDRRHFSDAIGKRDQRGFHAASVSAAHDRQIAVIQRTGAHPDHGLAGARRRVRKLHNLKVFRAQTVGISPCSQATLPRALALSR